MHSWRIYTPVNTYRFWSWPEVHPNKCIFVVREQQHLEHKKQETEGHSAQALHFSVAQAPQGWIWRAETGAGKQGGGGRGCPSVAMATWQTMDQGQGVSKEQKEKGSGPDWRQGTSTGLRAHAGAKYPTAQGQGVHPADIWSTLPSYA